MWRELKLGEKVQGWPTKGLSRDEWLEARNSIDGLGGSEIGIVMGINEYTSATRLFYEKVGVWPREPFDNMNMFMGRLLEDQLVDMWRAWEGSEESVMRNMGAGRKVNRSQKCNFIVRNPDFPWLFANIDNRILSVAGKKKQGILECKTISSYAADSCYKKNKQRHPNDSVHIRIPDYYILQVMTYMTVCGYDYGAIAVLESGNKFYVEEVPASDDLQTVIVEKTRDFMERVKEGRKAIKGLKKQNEIRQALSDFEPEADASKDYTDFHYEQEKLESETTVSDRLHRLAVDHDKLAIEKDDAIERWELIRNQIREEMGPYVKAKGDGLVITNRKRLNITWK